MDSGCGAGGNAQPADPAQAQETLRTVLDAWKAGEKPADLGRRSPPIQVQDQDWQAGYTLVGYKAATEGKLVGFDMNYPVDLELKNTKGNSVKKTAVYSVTTQPELLVMRQEG